MEGGGKGLQVSEIIHKKIQSKKQGSCDWIVVSAESRGGQAGLRNRWSPILQSFVCSSETLGLVLRAKEAMMDYN